MAQHVFQVGEKVYKGRLLGATYTVELVDGDSAVITGFGGKQIVKLSEIRPVVFKMDPGWFTFTHLPGMAYYIEWQDQETPVFKYGMNFATQRIEMVPKPFGSGLLYTGLDAVDFTPVKLTTEAKR